MNWSTRVFAMVILCQSSAMTMAQQDSGPFCEQNAGLLGVNFIQAQFVSVRTPSELRPFDKDMNGLATMLNVPAPWTEKLPRFLGQDLFVSGLTLKTGGSVSAGGIDANLDATLRSVSVGTTTYASLTPHIRPFVQLGYTYNLTQFQLDIPAIPIFSINDSEFKGQFLVNPGLELDLTDQIAWRSVLEVDTNEGFDDSIYRSELIAWPIRWLFVRGGIVGDVEGDMVGGIVGGGIAW